MAQGRGGRTSAGGGGRDRGPDSYYITSESDRRYAREARERLKRQVRRRWVIRAAIVALAALAVRLWGPAVMNLVVSQVGGTAEELKRTGAHIREGTSRRAGAELGEGLP